MVGLVLVSHSRPLAQALVNLIRQMAPEVSAIAIAAGVGPEREEFGTDAVEISEAIQSVFSPEGVLVLMDLGSALLSADMALELLPPEVADQVRFCPAPLVEGALAAAVQIGLGSDLETVYQEAATALGPKQEQLGAAPQPQAVQEPAQAAGATSSVDLALPNPHGLHARPAARFVSAAARFQADVRVTNLTTGKGPVSARSLNSLATLGALQNHSIRISASGPQAAEALATLSQMVNEGFGEGTELPPEPAPPAQAIAPALPAAEGTLAGTPISAGIALGAFYLHRPTLPKIPTHPADDPEAEWNRLQAAIASTQKSIEMRRARQSQFGEAEASIFDAHLLILLDPELHASVKQRILTQHENAAQAWHAAIQEVADSFEALEDAYLQQRAGDVLDVGTQVLFSLAGEASAPIQLSEPVIFYAHELTPTETAQLDMNFVLGIITALGAPTSHSAILARSLGIPCISGINLDVAKISGGTLLAMDGSSGTVWVDPPPAVQAELQAQREAWLKQRQELLNASQAVTYTADGRRVEVFANIGSLPDAQAAIHNGAEGVGLLRTEFLFLTRQTPPSEVEQYEALAAIGEVMGKLPVIVRTLDAGGDKELPYLHMPAEANPFLGVRAIRLSLNQPDLFTAQLRAILRAAEGHTFRIMFPMIATVEEVRQAKSWLEKAHAALLDEGLPHAWPVETGMMIEIPSSALLAQEFIAEVDFFSIGTNDLTQYTLAAERGSGALAYLADALHPAVLRLIEQVARAAHCAGKWAGVCGELAGDRAAVPILVGLGIDELSLNAAGIPGIKDAVRRINTAEAKALAEEALKASTASEVRELSKRFFEKLEPA